MTEVIREELAYVLGKGGDVHPNDSFDLAYHVAEYLGIKHPECYICVRAKVTCPEHGC